MTEIISTFRQRPKIKATWRAMYFGLATLLIPSFLGIFTSLIRPILDRVSVNNQNVGSFMGFSLGITTLILSIFALVLNIRVYQKGERSWVLWLGFIPAILIAAFWVLMIIGEVFLRRHF